MSSPKSVITRVNRIDEDMRRINDRLIRLETMVEVAKMQQIQTEKQKNES